MTGGRVAPVDRLSNMPGDPAAPAADSDDESNGASQSLPRTHASIKRQGCPVDGTLAPCWSYAEHPELIPWQLS
jgi:hypothetical protein